ncbi:UNVERIFIED_CONTAM: hypothetical protein K2H54_036226 [Gekko kuhli]
MASTEKPSAIIQKARRKLTEALLQIEPEVILDVVDAHLLLSQGEYFSLSRLKDPQGLLQSLIDTVLRKGEAAHEQFLDCLENLRHTFPSLRPLSEYLENGGNAEDTAQNLDSGTPLRAPQERNMDENPDPSVPSESRKDVEKPGVALPSGNRSGVQNLNAVEDGDGNGVERPGPVDLSHEAEIQSAALLPTSGTEKFGVAMSVVVGSEVENLGPSVSSEAGKEIEKAETVLVPSGMRSEAESPDDVLSSTQGNGGKNQDATEDGNGMEKPGVAAVCPERGGHVENLEVLCF